MKIEKKYFLNHLCAPNDTNGNPRRVFVVQRLSDGLIEAAFDEGYSGREAWTKHLDEAEVIVGIRINVTVSEYKWFIREYRESRSR